MIFFTQKYPDTVWRALLLGFILLISPLSLWAELSPNGIRSHKRIHLAYPTKPQPITANSRPSFDSDPIRFRLIANKQQVKPGEEVELTITAQHANILPSQLFTCLKCLSPKTTATKGIRSNGG